MPTDPLLYKAVQTLAGMCDGAQTQDGAGFNGTDSKFGKQLASIPPEAWDLATQREAWEMLFKYRLQLGMQGIVYDDIKEPKEVKKALNRGVRAIDVRNGKVMVFLPYGDTAYPKQALGATWNRDLKGWQVAVSKYGSVLSWAKANSIGVSERAQALLSTTPATTSADYIGTASLEKDGIHIKFDYNPALLDAIRTIPGRRWEPEWREWIIPKEAVSLVKQLATQYNIFLTNDVKRLRDYEIKLNPKVGASGENFALRFNYDDELLKTVRQIPGSQWEPLSKAWIVPLESVAEVIEFIQRYDAEIAPQAQLLLDRASIVSDIVEASAAHDANITIPNFGSDKFKLFPFQRAGVAYAMQAMGFEYIDGEWVRARDVEGGVLIGDEMGLGKTSQGLGTIAAAKAFPAVLVCPASLKLNWKREAEQWIPNVKVAVLTGTSGNMPDADFYVVNYDILSHWVEKFPPIKGLVLDESHYIKNGAAQRSKACIQLSDKVVKGGIRVCLSGTPIVNRPTEIMTQLRVIKRLEDFGGATKFRNAYGNPTNRNLAALNRKLRASCYVRRRKTDVLTELPPKRWSPVIVEGDPKIMKEYKEAEADIVRYLSELAMQLALESGATSKEAENEAWRKALRARAAEQLVAISTLKQIAARAKMKVAEQWIKDFLDNDKKLVIFGWHRSVVDEVAERFSNNVKIQGGITAEKRQEAVDLFQTDDNQKVIACNIKAAGVGLTLTAASDVLFLEQGWTPSDMEQGADRCHRIGQKDSVTAWLMLTANTIDEDIASLIDAKRSIVDRAIDGSDADDEESNSIVGDLIVALAERGLNNAD